MFNSSEVPTFSELNGFLNTINSELDLVVNTPKLVEPTLHSIAKAVQLFASQCEGMVEHDMHEKNVSIFSLLNQIESFLRNLHTSNSLPTHISTLIMYKFILI